MSRRTGRPLGKPRTFPEEHLHALKELGVDKLDWSDPAHRRVWDKHIQRTLRARKAEDPEYVEKERKRAVSRREAMRDAHVQKHYGISLQEQEELLEAQGGACAICGTTDTPRGGSWRVDHDHHLRDHFDVKRISVRGLLCDNCNVGLGCFKDDVLRLRAAIEYLNDPPARYTLDTVSPYDLARMSEAGEIDKEGPA